MMHTKNKITGIFFAYELMRAGNLYEGCYLRSWCCRRCNLLIFFYFHPRTLINLPPHRHALKLSRYIGQLFYQ